MHCFDLLFLNANISTEKSRFLVTLSRVWHPFPFLFQLITQYLCDPLWFSEIFSNIRRPCLFQLNIFFHTPPVKLLDSQPWCWRHETASSKTNSIIVRENLIWIRLNFNEEFIFPNISRVSRDHSINIISILWSQRLAEPLKPRAIYARSNVKCKDVQTGYLEFREIWKSIYNFKKMDFQ